MSPSPVVFAKAQGLVAAGEVRQVPASVFEVGRYLVVVREAGPWCSCPTTTVCSHITAAAVLARHDSRIAAPATWERAR